MKTSSASRDPFKVQVPLLHTLHFISFYTIYGYCVHYAYRQKPLVCSPSPTFLKSIPGLKYSTQIHALLYQGFKFMILRCTRLQGLLLLN